jgi:hypothetical protein
MSEWIFSASFDISPYSSASARFRKSSAVDVPVPASVDMYIAAKGSESLILAALCFIIIEGRT